MKTARKPKKPLESAIQKECLARLAAMGVPAWRRNVAAMTGEYKGRKRFIKAGERGQADIYGFFPHDCQRPAAHLEIEIKRPPNKPSLDQITWLRKTNETTGASFWVDNVDTLEEVVIALLAGGRIVYSDEKCKYPSPVKGSTGKVLGPSWDFDVEFD